MKKVTLVIALAALVLFAGCKKDNQTKGTTLKASIEQHKGDSRTELNPDNGAINWTVGDKILVNNGTSTVTFNLTSSNGTAGTFTYNGDYTFGESNVAVYPETATLTGTTVGFTLPEEQTFTAEGTFGEDMNPMMGSFSDPNNLIFTSLCGVLGISLTGDNIAITDIEVESKANEALNGAFECTATNPVLAPASGNAGTNKVRLNCVTTLTSQAQRFYFVLPVGTLAQGFTLNVYNNAADPIFSTDTDNDISIVLNTINQMPVIPVTLAPAVVLPTVTTVSQATGISGSGAICSGTITSDGNGTISAYGICYSTTNGFAGENGTHVAGENLDNGDFSVVLNGLEGSTQYYFRAYAENPAGRTYGDQSTFITLYPGLLNGMFTITGNHHVSFSKGNLQYTKSTAEWSFMGHQYDIVEELNQEVGTDYANQDVVSLFGWGTSGYNHGTTCYQPWCTSEDGASYFVNTNLNGNADWGYNAITNGGNTQSQWKTLTTDEWAYIFNTRGASTVNGTANARYAKAMVNGIYGMILFPDVYTHPSSVAQPVGINQAGDAGWNGNNYTIADFALMEANGAVFLPVAGRRDGSTVQQWVTGYYWSRSYFSLTQYYSAEYLYFDEGNVNPSNRTACWRGLSVRLVKYLD